MTNSRLKAVFVIWAFCFLGVASFALAEEEYTIGAGDLLSIQVFDEPSLSLSEVRVNGVGAFSFPLIGEIKANGLTSQQLEARLENLLLDGYLKKPQVSVSILQYRMFYVHGEVKKPGGYPYVDGLTVQKAVALAGGFTDRASERKIKLIKEKGGEETSETVPLSAPVEPGNIISVGESLF